MKINWVKPARKKEQPWERCCRFPLEQNGICCPFWFNLSWVSLRSMIDNKKDTLQYLAKSQMRLNTEKESFTRITMLFFHNRDLRSSRRGNETLYTFRGPRQANCKIFSLLIFSRLGIKKTVIGNLWKWPPIFLIMASMKIKLSVKF